MGDGNGLDFAEEGRVGLENTSEGRDKVWITEGKDRTGE